MRAAWQGAFPEPSEGSGPSSTLRIRFAVSEDRAQPDARLAEAMLGRDAPFLDGTSTCAMKSIRSG